MSTRTKSADAALRRTVLAMMATQSLTAEQISGRLGRPYAKVTVAMEALELLGHAHSQRTRQYPTGPLVTLWFPGPRS
jgi:predicted Rossmann fold nucleotide-binding protein DprA/Smf involved in DNA uptake